MIIVMLLFSKSLVFKMPFSVHTKRKAGVSKFRGLKNGFEKFRFRDGLVWTKGLTVEINLRFQIP